MVMYDLGVHKPKRVREVIEDRGSQLLYLPAYLPHYNLIEKAFSKVKPLFFFGHAEYRPLGQLL